jgi:hypothetical protein
MGVDEPNDRRLLPSVDRDGQRTEFRALASARRGTVRRLALHLDQTARALCVSDGQCAL